MARYLKIALLAILISLLGQDRANAHGYLVRSTPADRSVVVRAPQQVQVWFSEGLEPRFSSIAVFDQAGQQVDIGDGGVDEQNSAKLVVTLPDNLPPGAYLIRIRPVFTSDGHVANDTLIFWVGEQTGSIETEGASGRVIALEAIWRVGLIITLSIFFGLILLYAVILRPIWNNYHGQVGKLPSLVIRNLTAALWLLLLTAVVLNILSLLQLAMTLFNASLSQVVQDSLWQIVVEGSNFGDVWKLRMLILVGMLAVQIIATQQARNRPQNTHSLWLLNGGLALLALYTISQISHASGATLWRDMTLLVDYLHLTAVAAWVGGLVGLSLFLRSMLSPLTREIRTQVLIAILRRFSLLGTICISVVIATGIYASAANLYEPRDLAETNYGLTLLAKWMLMLPLLGIAVLHQLLINPQRATRLAHSVKRYFTKLPQTLQIETLFAVVVIAAAAILSGTPPPKPNSIEAASTMTRAVSVEGYDLTVAVSPGTVGANSYDINIQQDGQPVQLSRVQLRFSYPRLARYTEPLLLEEAEPGLWIGADGEVNRADEWLALIDFTTLENEHLRAALRWEFEAESSLTGKRTGTWIHWLSLLGIIGVLGVWVTPVVKRLMLYLEVSLASLSLIIGIMLFTIGLGLGGFFIIQQTGESVREKRDTPPEQVNSVFPDNVSIQLGQQFYTEQCETCHGANLETDNTEIPSLVTALENRKDEDLYRILTRGILGRHQYGVELSDSEKWSLINWLRAY